LELALQAISHQIRESNVIIKQMIQAQQIHLAPEAYTGFHIWRGILKIVGQDHFSTSNVLNVAELNYM
jgi:uncharacterized protein YbbK (DUF523 family)